MPDDAAGAGVPWVREHAPQATASPRANENREKYVTTRGRLAKNGGVPTLRATIWHMLDATPAPQSHSSLTERLLTLMDQKDHWAYPYLTRPGLTRAQLFVHFTHEYEVYVRDFPALLAGALAQTPPFADVRRALAENLYEEQTGGLSGVGPHPELFLEMMEGLGFERRAFESFDAERELHPAALAYRAFLRDKVLARPWQAAVALTTIWIEGSLHERAELAGTRVRPQGDEGVRAHPLVVHYGCPPSAMRLTLAHAMVEGAHRKDAWRCVVPYTRDGSESDSVESVCREALVRWHAYRDGVAARMGLARHTAE